MPLPIPKDEEEKQEFISRCIKYEKHQDTDMTDDQIKAACYDKWRKSVNKADLEDLEKEDIASLGSKIAEEICKRKRDSDMDYTVTPDSGSDAYKKFWEAVKEELSAKDIETLTSDKIKKSIKKKYWTTAKPYYRFYLPEIHKELKSEGWNKKDLLIDVKADGLRLTSGVVDGDGYFYVDPEDLKEKSPDVTDRLPNLKKELENCLPDNTIVDSEFIAMSKNNEEIYHRTTTNSLLNSDVEGEKLETFATIFVFDVLFWKGKDIRDWPLKERLEVLQQLDFTENILVEDVSASTDEKADAYRVEGNDKSSINKAVDRINDDKIGRPKHLAEGVMVKLMGRSYETEQNKGWGKAKKHYELDVRVLVKDQVKDSPGVYNYTLGLDVPKDYATKIIDSDLNKPWYHNLGVLSDNELYRGKEALEHDGQWVMILGKSDNHEEEKEISIGSIIRITTEEVLRYNNPKFEDYPRYSIYIGVFTELIPDKKSTDGLDVANKLARFQPKRIPIEELKHIQNKCLPGLDPNKMSKEEKDLLRFVKEEYKARDEDTGDFEDWIEDQNIPDEKYKEIAEDNEPLPEKFYIDHREGDAWAQFHFRGLTEDDVEKYKDGEMDLENLIQGHSVHCDLRMQLGDDLVQWVITQDEMKDYLDTLKGDNDPDTGNVSKGLAIVKPSAIEPEKKPEDWKKSDDDEDLILDEEGSKVTAPYILEENSYFIEPGDVGATSKKYAYMTTIWLGKAKAGVQRKDFHEYFLTPDDNLQDKNKELFNGRFVVKVFVPGGDPKWWIWKAKNDPKPIDPLEHADIGHYYPIPAEKIDKRGHEEYIDQSQEKFKEKLD